MDINKAIQDLSLQIEELTETLKVISDKQNTQYTDIMLQLRKLEEKLGTGNTTDTLDEDDLYEEAREAVIETGKASTSYLQRRFRLGYAKAARIMDKLEANGVIGPGDGATPREVLISNEDDSEN